MDTPQPNFRLGTKIYQRNKEIQMKLKTLLFGSFLLFFCAVDLAAVTFHAYYEDKAQPPYYLGATEKVPTKNPGVAVEMVKMLEKKVPGIKVKFSRAPWKRCLKNLESGKADGIFSGSFKEKRKKFGRYPNKGGKVDPSRRLATHSYTLYKLKGSKVGWNGKKFSNLGNGKIGAPAGYSIVGDLKKKWGVKNVEESPSTVTDFKKLLKKRVAAVAAQTVTGDATMGSRKEFKKIVRIDKPLVTKPYYLLISHQFAGKHPKLAEKIWNAIRDIRKNEQKKIATKYAK